MRVRIPFVICSSLCTVCTFRITLLGTGVQSEWWISCKREHVIETDSKQVPWGKCEKYFEKRIKRACTCWMESRQDFKCLERLLRVNKNAASHYVNVICNVVCDVRGVSFLTCQFSIFIMNTCVLLRSTLMGVWVFDCISLWKLGGTCLVVSNRVCFLTAIAWAIREPWHNNTD